MLGGSGKKEASGDIDIAVSEESVKKKTGKTVDEAVIDIVDKINATNKSFDLQYEFLPGFNILSVAFPQYNVGGRSKQTVQVDFMGTDNLEYTKFIYFSPSDKETFAPAPGIYRTELLKAIIKATTYKIDAKFPEDGSVKDMSYMSLSPNNGLVMSKYTFESPKTGRRLKNKILADQKNIRKNVNKIIKIMFREVNNSFY